MPRKPTYKELEQSGKELIEEVAARKKGSFSCDIWSIIDHRLQHLVISYFISRNTNRSDRLINY